MNTRTKDAPLEDSKTHSHHLARCPWRAAEIHLRHAEANVLVLADLSFVGVGEIERFNGDILPTTQKNISGNPEKRYNAQVDINTDPFHPNHGGRNAKIPAQSGGRLYHVLDGTHDAKRTPDSPSFTSALIASLSELREADSTDNAGTMPFTVRQLLTRIKRHVRPEHAQHQHLAKVTLLEGDIYLEPLVTRANSRYQLSRLRSPKDADSESASEVDDAASVFSEMSIASSVSSIHSLSDEDITETLIRAFTYNIFHTLELASLSTAALAEPRIGSARFARNFRRLIAQFGSNARKQGTTSTQLQAARLLRSKRISSRAAQLVVELIEADQLAALRVVPEYEACRPSEADEPPVSGGPDIVDASGDADASDEDGDDGEIDSEADDSDQAEDDDDSILSQGTIDQIKLFLLRSEAYATFRTQLLDFVHDPYEKRLYAALRDNAIISESGTPVSPEAKFGLVKELAWVPPSLFSFVFEVHASTLNGVKGFVEDSLGEVWDWWPFRQRVRSLKPGYCRLTWVTVSCHSVSYGLLPPTDGCIFSQAEARAFLTLPQMHKRRSRKPSELHPLF
jgi:hypothetical protein